MSKKLFCTLGAFALGVGAGLGLYALLEEKYKLFAEEGEEDTPASPAEAACEQASEALEAQEQPNAAEKEDALFGEAVALFVEADKASTTLLQRQLGVGYGRAARMLARMDELGLITPADGNRARKVLPAAVEYLAQSGITDVPAE